MADDDVIRERAADTEALLAFVENHLDEVLDQYADELLKEVAGRNRIALSDSLRGRVKRAVDVRRVDLRPGHFEDAILDVITEVRREGQWGELVDAFVNATDPPRPLRPSERRKMLQVLQTLGVDPAVNNPAREHTIARVYQEVVGTTGGSDPAALTAPPGRVSAWNFRVRPFAATSARQVRTESILAAGALSWCYEVGERMGVYKVTDALVYRWWIGDVDFRDEDLVAQLYRYWKLREDRPSEEERALLFHRIFALGDVQVAGRMVVNEAFPLLWRNLMEEISLYLSKSESSFRNDQISRAGVFQAATELQYSLSDHMIGMGILQVTEMYHQLRADRPDQGNFGALDILEHEEVVNQFAAGSDRHVASVIRRLATDEFGTAPNVGSIATSADQGYAIYQWLADFRQGSVDDHAFEALIEAGKAWILAQQAAGTGLALADHAVAEHGGEEGWDDEPRWEDEDDEGWREEDAQSW